MNNEAEALIDRRHLKRRLTVWRAVAVGLVVLGLVLLIPWSGKKDSPHVARVHVGTLIGDELERAEKLGKIERDENVRAVVLHINSPGGTVAGSEALYTSLRGIAEEKPVVAFISTVGASGGYIAAIGADWIVARRNAMTGSIGVIFRVPEFSRLLDNIGVGVTEMRVGDIKGEPSLHKPMSEEAREAFQTTLNDAYDWFVSLVAERRGMDRETVLGLADGRVYTGSQALENGLIDEVGGEAAALRYLGEKHDIDADLPLVDYLDEDEIEGPFGRVLSFFGLSNPSGSQLALDGLLALWHP